MKKLLNFYSFVAIAFLSGLSCGKEDFDSNPGAFQQLKDTVIDIDGNIYHTIKIGNQIWMKENLNATKYRSGESIPYQYFSRYWSSNYSDAWCEHPDSASDGIRFGKLYNLGAVKSKKGLAPQGWHIPSDEEWNALAKNLGGVDVAGGKMKESGTAHWATPNNTADDSSGFKALPGGYRSDNGQFFGLGSFIYLVGGVVQ